MNAILPQLLDGPKVLSRFETGTIYGASRNERQYESKRSQRYEKDQECAGYIRGNNLSHGLIAFASSCRVMGEADNSSAGATSVRVTNESYDPVPVRDVGIRKTEPFDLLDTLNIDPGSDGGSSPSFTVPEDKRLVLEGASVRFPVNSNVTVSASILKAKSGAGTVGLWQLPMIRQRVLPTADEYVASETVRIYFEPGDRIFLSVRRSDTVGSTSAVFSLHGELISVK